MKKAEFIESIVIDKKLVNVGIDDYGQCYFFEFVDDIGNLQEICCGTYNSEYKQEIYDYFKVNNPISRMDEENQW